MGQDLTLIQTILPNWSKNSTSSIWTFLAGSWKPLRHALLNQQSYQWQRNFPITNNAYNFIIYIIETNKSMQLYIAFAGCRDSCYKGKWFKCPNSQTHQNPIQRQSTSWNRVTWKGYPPCSPLQVRPYLIPCSPPHFFEFDPTKLTLPPHWVMSSAECQVHHDHFEFQQSCGIVKHT